MSGQPGTKTLGRPSAFGAPLPAWLMLLSAGAAGLLLVLAAISLPYAWWESDLLAYYGAGRVLATAQPDRLYDIELFREWQTAWIGPPVRYPSYPFLYAPVYAAAFLPLAPWSLFTARLLWLGLGVGLLGLGFRLLRPLTGMPWTPFLLLVLPFTPLTITLLAGQMTPLTFLVVVILALRAWRGDEGWLSGALAGVLLYKPQLLIPLLIFWLLRRRWAPLLGFGLTAALLGLVSVGISLQASLDYLLRMPPIMASISEMVEATGRAVTLASLVGPGAATLIALGVLALLLVAWQRPGARAYRHAMLWLAPLLVTPYVISYDVMLLLVPLALLFPLLRTDRLLQATTAFVWVVQFGMVVAGGGVLVPWGVLALFGVCAWRTLAPPSLMIGRKEDDV